MKEATTRTMSGESPWTEYNAILYKAGDESLIREIRAIALLRRCSLDDRLRQGYLAAERNSHWDCVLACTGFAGPYPLSVDQTILRFFT
jgi:hypothetical protein